MTKQEAEAYATWYIDNIKDGILYLVHKIGDQFRPDYSDESMKCLSEWMYQNGKRIEIPLEVIEELISRENPPQHVAMSMRMYRMKLSPETINNCVAISMYFSQCLIKNAVKEYSWHIDYKKNSASENSLFLKKEDPPVGYCDARSVVLNTVSRMLESEGNDDLYIMYKRWVRIFLEGNQFLRDEIKQIGKRDTKPKNKKP